MSITVTPLTAAIGAEIGNVDMANVSQEDFHEIHKALLDHKVIFFRDQDISTEEHIAFGRLFGELEIHPFVRDTTGYPELVVLESTAERQIAASFWHSDVTWRQEPSMGSILRGVVMPAAGGDTCFANAERAYDSLSDEWKERVEGLIAVHDFGKQFGRKYSAEKKAEMQAKYPPAHHPVIRTHPETGAKAIYTNRAFVTHIAGLSAEESDEILDHLERAIMSPNVQCRFKWDVNSFAFWDNRAVQHFATTDFFPNRRKVERVTVIGEKPY